MGTLQLWALPDEELLECLTHGDSDALNPLFRRYHRLVLKIARRILRDSGEAEDLLQEVFLEVYRKAERFDRTKGSAKTWILQSAYYKSLSRRRYLAVRSAGNHQQIPELAYLEGAAARYSRNGVGDMSPPEQAHIVRQGFQTLTPQQRETLEAVFFKGLLLTEIADRTSESLGNVRNNYYRGLKKLRILFQGDPTWKESGKGE